MGAVNGTNNSEVINLFDGVTWGSDTISAFDGDDTIFGLGGNDEIKGGGGADAINGGVGSDTAFYSDSTVGVWVSLLTGTGFGGSAQGDTLTSIENLTGSFYDDLLIGDGGANVLSGSNGNDTLKGGGGTDELNGGNGDDELRGGAGMDVLNGGAGNDTITYSDSPAGVNVSFATGGGGGGDAQGDSLSGIENMTGSAFLDILWGDGNANVLQGLDGDDVLYGFGGNDALYGGSGSDHLEGMDGADSLHGGNDDDELFGQDGVDTLRGEAGNDYLDGGAGADTMIGGAGDDTYYVDSIFEVVSESAGEGIDTVYAFASCGLPLGSDVEILAAYDPTGVAALSLTGSNSGNQLIGNDGNNVLVGRGGTDEMIGRNGNDVYHVSDASDSVVETGGQGLDEVWAFTSWTLTEGADVETLRIFGEEGVAAIDLTGNSSGNAITGNYGNNVLNGGAGNDELTGLDGQDAFLFNTALDAAGNIDVITDFNVTDDTIRLDDAIFSNNLGLGNISSGEFVIGAAAQDANDRIIYDSGTGALSYDSDGNGGTDAIQFAEVTPGLALTYLDFFVV